MNRQWLFKGEQLLQTVWIGGLLVVGYLAVPILFQTLDDRRLAGAVAGSMFSAMSIVGFICGGALLLSALVASGSRWLKTRRVQVLLIMLCLVTIGFFVLQPMMQTLKAVGYQPGSEVAAQFGRLHGISSLLYLATSLLGVYLVMMQARTSGQA